MKWPQLLTWMALAGVMVATAAGFFTILDQRFSAGELYPHYASYRPDPLGTSALYETLSTLEGYTVQRNQTHLHAIRELDDQTAVLLLGYPSGVMDKLRAPADSRLLEAVRQGSRLVITLNPGMVPRFFEPKGSSSEEDWFERRRKLREQQRGENSDEENPSDDQIEKSMADSIGPTLADHLGFALEPPRAFVRPDDGWTLDPLPDPAHGPATEDLPPWWSQLRLQPGAGEWKTIASIDQRPVLIERPLGKGSVVIVSDSYFASNEALHSGGNPEFLLWLLGGKTRIVFDETIHGSTETGGAMKLIRRYRLHGIFPGLLLLIVLWAWRSADPLARGSSAIEHNQADASGAVAGENSARGLIHLLRRSIPRSELLERCLAVWRASQTASPTPEQTAHLVRLLEQHQTSPRQHDLLTTYRHMVAALRKR